MLKYLSKSKKGLRRDRNQDRLLIVDETDYYLFLVFDGVSSLSESYLFINILKKRIKSKLHKLYSTGSNLGDLLFEAHSEALYEKVDGMSTVSGLFYSKRVDCANYISIGDSRVYIFSNQYLEKVSEDDSLQDRPNILTRCLGTPDLSLNDFRPKEVETNHNFLICTDGFYNLMSENLKEYFSTYNFKNFRNIEKKLSHLQRGKNSDDSSYILIKHEIQS
jgi:serine/threonine protein phosphatase PrpC